MHPILTIAAVASLAVAGAAYAAKPLGPVSEISITFGKDFAKEQNRADKVIGQREKDRLEKELRDSVERALGGTSANGGRLELVIEDAKPNRPTWTQLTNKPGLSYANSFGIGGAKVSGVYVSSDGARTPVGYRYYESDISNSRFATEWYDAERAFDRFAQRLVEGKATPG